jgi:Tfp pilus assembly protein PilV
MKTRRGMTLVELFVAATMLGMLLVVCVQLLSATAAQRRAADQRQLAIMELSNVLERIAARPWADLTPQAFAAEKPSAEAVEKLPEAELKVEVTTPSAEPKAKRITVSLRWQDRNSQFVAPVKITTWKYATENKPLTTDN